MCSSDLFLGFIAILFPPLPVWVKTGLCSADSLINILLCCLGFLPGLLHAWYIIAKYPDEYDLLPQDSEAGRVTYVYVQPGSAPTHGAVGHAPGGQAHIQHCHGHHGARQGGNAGYGTVKPMEAPVVVQGQNGTWNAGSMPEIQRQQEHGEGNSAVPPPSYAQAVKGDHKVQNHD